MIIAVARIMGCSEIVVGAIREKPNVEEDHHKSEVTLEFLSPLC